MTEKEAVRSVSKYTDLYTSLPPNLTTVINSDSETDFKVYPFVKATHSQGALSI